MVRCKRIVFLCLAFCAVTCRFANVSHAGTIIKLGLGGDGAADIEFDGTTLMTVNQFDAATTGNQNTNIEFQGFLDGLTDVVGPPPGSFTLSGLMTAGLATGFPMLDPVLVIQNFTGGTFDLYNAADVLLLSGQLDGSTLAGPLGPPATGALFTSSFADVTAGTLKSLIKPNSLTLSMSLTDISSGVGLSLGGAAPALNPFHADVTLNISAEPIPEPASALIVIIGALPAAFAIRHRHR